MNPTSYSKVTCICSNIPYGFLIELIKQDISITQLQQEYGVGNYCSKCLPYIKNYYEKWKKN